MSEFGLIMCLGKASWAVWSRRVSGRPMTKVCGRSCLFFGNVNQVLVRLWARHHGSRQWSVVSGQNTILASDDWKLKTDRVRRSAELSDRELLFARTAPQRSAARVQRRCERFCWIRKFDDRASDREQSGPRKSCCACPSWAIATRLDRVVVPEGAEWIFPGLSWSSRWFRSWLFLTTDD
jgi:hypothetical protein